MSADAETIERTDAASAARILIVDDERSMREMLAILLRREGHDVVTAENGRSAIDFIGRRSFDVVVSDARMPDVDGLEVLRQARAANPAVIAIMVTAYGSPDLIRGVETLGVNDYVEKPFNTEVLKFRIRKELDRKRLHQENALLKRAMRSAHQFENIIGTSSAMLRVFDLVDTIAPTGSTILISGESGTGKELIARAIHVRSSRAERPFVAVNCGALTETLLESELFGHVRGAFTGADSNKKGLIEVADKGTIFLDEIGEMSPMLQVKLLRVLQERRFRRVGGTEEIDADIRIIAATNRDLARMVSDGQFREDLFYRINVIPVRMPPLRERTGDIPQLAEHFVAKFAPQMKKEISSIAAPAMVHLTGYAWPGNVRELENAMERAVALERTTTVTVDSLPDAVRGTAAAASRIPSAVAGAQLPDTGFDLEQHVQHIEREYIAEALRRSGGVKVKAAELLGMSFRSFRYYMKKYNLG
ncbi:MAG TPA: sigma-54 dependent transcriptional regulator [Vicinamibacterales bacterium]|jgi:two-component system response regulator PilR (NtrC family)|nr:sigma-54 dependent transcriptional regulator [Vicinamibacterales bacterium]